eukprot:EG_transcript_4888
MGDPNIEEEQIDTLPSSSTLRHLGIIFTAAATSAFLFAVRPWQWWKKQRNSPHAFPRLNHVQVGTSNPMHIHNLLRQLFSGTDEPQGTPSLGWAMQAAAADADVANVVIVGSGPAGFTAAIYAARANLRPVLFEGYQAGGVPGGQLMLTTEVENFPGFPEGITGPELMERMRKQAVRWGTQMHTEDVEYMDLSQRPFVIRSAEREVKAHAVILATGATAKRLKLPSEEKFWNYGISACAICDGASPIFKGKELAVVGGGDTAVEEAVYLTKYGSHVHLLVRRDALRASKAMADRASNHRNITIHYNTAVEDAYGDSTLAGLHLKNTVTGETRDLPVGGLFYGIGHTPNSKVFKDQVALDHEGYVAVKPGSCETNIEGVFAAGDLQDHEWRQAITAAGSGCMAALSTERYLVRSGLLIEYAPGAVVEGEAPGETAAPEKLLGKENESNFDIAQTQHVGEFALRKLYHESDRLLGVLYTSPSCGPCRVLKPIFSKVVDEYSSKMHFVLIDIEESPEIAEAAGVNGTPTIQFFKKKAKVGEMGGVKMKKDYREFIEQHI